MSDINKKGSGNIKVLLIPRMLETNDETLFKHFKSEFRKLFTFYIIRTIPKQKTGVIDYSKLLERCMDLVKTENIGIVLANEQVGFLVWAILGQRFSHILAPSVEAVFLSNHQYYKTVVIDAREHKIPFILHSFDDDCYDFAFHVMTSITPPCIMRPCLGNGHCSYEFRNRDELLLIADECKLDTEHIVGMHSYLINNFVDTKRYPMAAAHVVLLNSVLDSPHTKVHIEACVFQKDIIPWSLCDVLIPTQEDCDATGMFSLLKMPSDMSPGLQEKLWLEFRKDIKNLIEHGLDHTFLHGEYDVYEDGFIHLIALHIGPSVFNTKMYTHAMDVGNNMEATLQVSMGIRPQQPKSTLNDSVILNHLLLAFQSTKADSLINFSKALLNPNVWLCYLPGQDIVMGPTESHAVVGSIIAKGKSVKNCIEKIKTVRKESFKMLDILY